MKNCMTTVLGLMTISLSGVDNVGKTCQLTYVPETFEVRNGIHEYDDFLGNLVKEGRLKEWWFEESSDEELVRVLTRAAVQRAAVPQKSKFVIFDRGGVMFESVCIATIAVRRGCSLSEAQAIYEIVQESKLPVEDVRILLKHGTSVDESVAISLSWENNSDEVYKQYQRLLHEQMEQQERKYTHVVNVTGMSKIEVQNQIRAIVINCAGGRELAGFGPMFERVLAIVAFGGMSESGKSTVAMGTCSRMESCGVRSVRLKIGHFMDTISARLGTNSYDLHEKQQANLLIKELDRYLRNHYWNKIVTIESVHQFVSTDVMKAALGDLFHVIYLDATLKNRLERSGGMSTEEIHERDGMKLLRGVGKIKEMPWCTVIDNDNSTLEGTIGVVCELLAPTLKSAGIPAYSGKVNLFSEDFVLSAGAVLIHKTHGMVCIIRSGDKRRGWLLPKGRKNVGESLEDTAVREVFEETGYRCTLMPLKMHTRATLVDDFQDAVRTVPGACEPLMVSLRQGPTGQKLVFWYVAQVDESEPWERDTQMANESFEPAMYPPIEAAKLLVHAEEKALVRRAYDLFENSRSE